MVSIHKKRSLNEILDALSHIQRRTLLVALLEHNPQNDSPVIIGDDEGEKEAVNERIKLNHVHLPKLEEYGFIEWNQENNKVSKGLAFDEIRPLLELLDNHRGELPADWL
jgi:hypothetical protein